jgi:hypothetical protein
MDQGSREKSNPSGPGDLVLFGIFESFDDFPDYLFFLRLRFYLLSKVGQKTTEGISKGPAGL